MTTLFRPYNSFVPVIRQVYNDLRDHGVDVDAGRWQGYDTKGKPDLMTREIMNCAFSVHCARDGMTFHGDFSYLDQIASEIKPNRAWADEHFAERVGGVPMNPDPSHERWPWWRGQESSKQADGGKFTHTYSERFWPKMAGEQVFDGDGDEYEHMPGIRYLYGDLNDLIELLVKEPRTRQAYLPIFFPEDTGAVHEGRIPCTLGYHFMLRQDMMGYDRLHCWYHIRSCDYVRHFRDDLYLAVRLMKWVMEECQKSSEHWVDARLGDLSFTAYSMHYHHGDAQHVSP